MKNINDILNTILTGHVLDVLKEIPDESIDMIFTSPPYYGLRNYGTPPQVWGGQADCDHVWEYSTKKGITGGTKSKKVRAKGTENFQIVKNSEYAMCRCGAWLGELGQEPNFNLFLDHLMDIFTEARRVLVPQGTCWINIGDSYSSTNNGVTKKSLYGIPDRLKIRMIDDGWICRNHLVWHKRNAMPESVRDRFVIDYEPIYFFAKNPRYYFDQQKEPCVNGDPTPPRGSRGSKPNSGRRKQDALGKSNYTGFNARYTPKTERNVRSVWDIPVQPFKGAHFATFPPRLLEIPIKAGCPEGGIVMDMFFGSGTVGVVSKKLNRNFIGIDLKKEYTEMATERLQTLSPT